jgi:DNA (cytosine-5)-methyltransferase 1
MTPFKLLDCFAKAGGAGAGYAKAGFAVTATDIKPQRRSPHPLRVADFFDLEDEYLDGFDAIHASPPCQGYTSLRHAPGAKGAPRLIPQVRARLLAWADRRRGAGKPTAWVIENVEEARSEMPEAITLCGTMFGLGAQGCELHRHRLFESNIALVTPECEHGRLPVIGVYGGHARRRAASAGGRGTKDEWVGGHIAAMGQALGIDWMTCDELSEAIPPAYTKFLGFQLRASLVQQMRVAA